MQEDHYKSESAPIITKKEEKVENEKVEKAFMVQE